MAFSKITSKEYLILKFIIENNGYITFECPFYAQNKDIIRSMGAKGYICSVDVKYPNRYDNIEIGVDSLGRLEYNLYEKDQKNTLSEI